MPKYNLITVLTMRADDTTAPTPALLADLIDAVLRVPGLRVKRVEVCDLSTEPQATNRRIREATAKRVANNVP